MANAGQLQKSIELIDFTTNRVWQDFLKPNHSPNTAIRQESQPFYLCNARGIEERVAPTLVSYRGSLAFRNHGPGMVEHTKIGEWRKPLPIERE